MATTIKNVLRPVTNEINLEAAVFHQTNIHFDLATWLGNYVLVGIATLTSLL